MRGANRRVLTRGLGRFGDSDDDDVEAVDPTSGQGDEDELAPMMPHHSIVLRGALKRSSPNVSFAANITMFNRLWHLSTVNLCFAYIVGIAIRSLLVYITWEHFKDTKLAEIMEDTEVFALLSLSAMLFPLVTMWMAKQHREELISAVSDIVASAATLSVMGISPTYADEIQGHTTGVVSDTYVVVVTILRRNNKRDVGKSPQAFRSLVQDLLKERMAAAFRGASEAGQMLAASSFQHYNSAVSRMEMAHLGTYSTAISSHNAALFFAYFSLMPAHFVNKFGLHSIYISVGFGFLFMGPLVVAQLIQNPFSGSPHDVMNEDVWTFNVAEYQAARSILRRLKAAFYQCFSIAW